jgi:hypothetical protein
MLAPEAVTIGEQMVVPQQYAESVRDGHREIEIIALSDSETARGLHALREARDTVQVVREGVNPDPVPMVVDNVKYADEEGGFYLAVRLESPDEIDLTSVPWTLDFFGASHLAAKAARARLRALTAMLEAKGVLTSEDMEQLDADSEMKLDEVGFEFNAVRRLSDCRLN